MTCRRQLPGIDAMYTHGCLPCRLAIARHPRTSMEPKTQFIRLVYASRATFPAGLDNASVNADVARILMQSRRNNPANGLVGALYLSDGCFFQCLEGPAEAVDALYKRLPKDTRHRDLTVLSRESIDRPSFSSWSMKYVPNASVVRQLLDRHGLVSFDPYSFSPAMLSDMVGLLLSGPDAVLASRPEPARPTSTDDVLAIARRSQRLATLALIGSVLSLALAIAF